MQISKKNVFVYFASIILFFLLLELMYTFYNISTNASMQRLEEINQNKDKNYTYAIFGSSVTNGALGSNPTLYKDTFNGSTMGSTSITGQYLLLKRLLEDHKLKKATISFIPHMLNFNIFNNDNKRLQRFFNKTFTDEKSIQTIKDMNASYDLSSFKSDYIIERRFYLQNLLAKAMYKEQELYVNSKRIDKPSREAILQEKSPGECTKGDRKTLDSIVLQSKKFPEMAFTNSNRLTIERIATLREETGTEIYLILEPVPLTEYNVFTQTSMYSELMNTIKDKNIAFVDMNKLYRFKDCYFADRLHLKDKYMIIYEKLLIKTLQD